MDWVRGDLIGRGSFATVSLAIPTGSSSSTRFPLPTVVKSAEASTSSSLENEKNVLDRLGSSCPRIIRCFGGDRTFENGEERFNLFLEYAAGGSLADQVKFHGGRIPENKVRSYTRSVVEGLLHIHSNGFIHCDIKLQNILVFGDGEVKIADFGLAKEVGVEQEQGKGFECRGTPLFMSPESVKSGENLPPADVWALGCAVVEMVSGKPAWNVEKDSSMWSLLLRIGAGEESPEIPEEVSEEGRDFLEKCFVKDPRKRWTAEMLLKHPFVAAVPLKESPRCHFDFPDWVSSVPSSPESEETCLWDFQSPPCSRSPVDRLQQLVTVQSPVNWSVSDSWSTVR
ncbi:mitogen-activated protein kinase kinase kinase 20-like [Lotus japonicus]|uniref:mitogen-activated protein kinase kinase kinase 20-like n=1 Tax=Lotus japonicus TaxID=34305 RepID=UPI002589893B|nr:mitogen-activated protein kinase kinase kinase 20-like [Lotus japonicus]